MAIIKFLNKTQMSLQQIFKENPDLKLLSKAKLIKTLETKGISSKEINDYYKSSELHQVYAKPKKYKSLKITADPYSFQIDIAFLPSYKKYNKGIDAFLLLVDILSRKAFAYPLKSRKSHDIMEVYKKFIDSMNDQVTSVTADNEFNFKEFKEYNQERQINVFTDIAKDDHLTSHGNRLGIIDRFTRTIKNYIQKYMLTHENLKWTEYLHKLIDLYNDTPNSGIKDMTPNEVFEDDLYMEGLHKGQLKYNEDVNESFDIEPGDRVRAMLGKGTFEKEKQKFSSEIYTIVKQIGYKFELVGEDGKIVKRKYRASELLKVDKVADRLGTAKRKAEKEHKHTTRVRKATGKTYDEATESIKKANEPRPNRVKKTRERLDL
jgi:hypothetical protein